MEELCALSRLRENTTAFSLRPQQPPQSTYRLPTHTKGIHPARHPTIHLSINPLVQLPIIHPSTYLPNHPSSHTFMHSLIYLNLGVSDCPSQAPVTEKVFSSCCDSGRRKGEEAGQRATAPKFVRSLQLSLPRSPCM